MCFSPKSERLHRSPSMSSPEEKKTKTNVTNPSLDSLPDELLLICIAHVSRLYYPTLSFVSKRFRSLLTSPELYKTRSLLGRTESCLYVCLDIFPDYLWFTLCRKPDQTLDTSQRKKKKKESNGYILANVPVQDSPRAHFSSLVSIGSNIYNIGGSVYYAPSSTVSVLDCISHTWSKAPSLRVELRSVSATVVDHKIYVGGRYKDGYSFEVLDTETQIWDPVPSPFRKRGNEFIYSKIACIDGEFHVKSDGKVVAYNAKEGRWGLIQGGMCDSLFSDPCCEIENVLYTASKGVFRWYDDKVRMWKELKGLVGLPKFKLPPGACVRLADYGGKMAVLWKESWGFSGGGNGVCNKSRRIWCAEIALERRGSCEIWGTVEWFGHVLTLPKSFNVVNVVAATV